MAITGELKVTPQQLTNTASSFRSTGSTVRSLTTQMLSKVRSLNGRWMGEAQQLYSTKFNALDGDMAQIYAKISEHVEDLIQMADIYAQAERTNVSNFNTLKTDYIHQG